MAGRQEGPKYDGPEEQWPGASERAQRRADESRTARRQIDNAQLGVHGVLPGAMTDPGHFKSEATEIGGYFLNLLLVRPVKFVYRLVRRR